MWDKWKLVSVHLEIVLIWALDSSRFAPNVSRARKSFWTHPMVLLGDMCQVEANFGLFRASVNLGAT
jgi:hypothetical protein